MMKHLRTPSVVLLLAVGTGAPATAVQVNQPGHYTNAAQLLPYFHVSQSESERFHGAGPGEPAAIRHADHPGPESTDESMPVLYRPPLRGAPASRIGGGSRGMDGADWTVRVLAPRHTGLTNRPSPSLYWYTSKSVSGRQMEVTIIKRDALDPILETRLPGRMAMGIQRLDLSRWGIELETGAEYEWFVSVVRKSGQRSSDIIAGGTIQRVAPDPRVQVRLSGSSARAMILIYAAQGIWYDAIDTLNRLIEKSPEDDALRDQLASLLRQVGLEAAIAGGRKDG